MSLYIDSVIYLVYKLPEGHVANRISHDYHDNIMRLLKNIFINPGVMQLFFALQLC